MPLKPLYLAGPVTQLEVLPAAVLAPVVSMAPLIIVSRILRFSICSRHLLRAHCASGHFVAGRSRMSSSVSSLIAACQLFWPMRQPVTGVKTENFT